MQRMHSGGGFARRRAFPVLAACSLPVNTNYLPVIVILLPVIFPVNLPPRAQDFSEALGKQR